jgi:tRNA threonylcarbamoyladenosine biosynthesis protein TsaB
MTHILSLESSTDVCSVALHENGILLRKIVIEQPQSHAEKLAPSIKQIFEEASLSISHLSAVAISSGPGSYTGLRIGASTAKGICYALDVPLIAIPTLNLLAYQALKEIHSKGEILLCPMIDARRMEVYTEIYNSRLEVVNAVKAMIVTPNSLGELLAGQRVFFFGNGSAKCRGVIDYENATFLDGIVPSAAFLGEMAFSRFEAQQFEDLEKFKPFYLKDFVVKKAGSLLT